MGRPRISIDHSLCGDGKGMDPRECCTCLQVCDPAVFLLHQSFGVEEKDPFDPQLWRVTVMWPTLCTACMKCVQACPCSAVSVKP